MGHAEDHVARPCPVLSVPLLRRLKLAAYSNVSHVREKVAGTLISVVAVFDTVSWLTIKFSNVFARAGSADNEMTWLRTMLARPFVRRDFTLKH